MRDRVGTFNMNTKGEKVNGEKASVYSTGPINETRSHQCIPIHPTPVFNKILDYKPCMC